MREVREEAGIDVQVERLLYDIAADPPDGTYQRWRTYLCRYISGIAAPGGGEGWAELTAIRWLPLHDSGQWASALDGDEFLHAQLLRIRDVAAPADIYRNGTSSIDKPSLNTRDA